jgi:SAM-dependent methyltransferase
MTLLLHRRNMLHHEVERWRPPLFVVSLTRWRRSLDALRRVLDLQAASLWTDLRKLLPNCDGSVLDVGCGAQPYRRLLPSTVRYLGIDTAEAKKRFGYEVPDTRYFAGAIWPVSDASVDVVLATETLEHVPDPRLFLSEACRVLQPGGNLIITVPFAARWHYIPYDYWRFTPSALESLLGNEGFEDVRVFARGNEVTVACYKVMGVILALMFGTDPNLSGLLFRRAVGLLLVPLLLPLAVAAHWSLRSKGGDDCLGYTVLARRPCKKLTAQSNLPATTG